MLTLLTSAARTSSGTSEPTMPPHPELIEDAVFVLTVSAAANVAGDTLNVYLQHSWDGGVTWDDFVSFTQVLGNGGAVKHLAQWVRQIAPTTAMQAGTDATLTAGTVQQGPVGPKWRVKWVVVDGGAHGQSFTFKLEGYAMTRR